MVKSQSDHGDSHGWNHVSHGVFPNYKLYVGKAFYPRNQGPVSQKILSPLVILSVEKTMVTMVISELKSISRLTMFRKTESRSQWWPDHSVYRETCTEAV